MWFFVFNLLFVYLFIQLVSLFILQNLDDINC